MICYTAVRKYTPSLIPLSFARDLFQPLPLSLHAPPRHFMPWLRRMVLRSENMRSLAMNSITFLPPSPPNLSISLPILLSFLHPWTSPSNCRWTQSSQVTPGPCYTLSSLSSQLLPLYLLPSLSIKLSSLS